MSCIRVRTSVQHGGRIASSVQSLGCIHTSIEQGGIRASVDDVHHLSSTLLENGSMRSYLVCEADRDAYLRVTPVEPVWVTMTESGVYDVRSNTHWIIE